MCLGLEPSVAGWKVQTNPLSYGGTPGSRNFSAFVRLLKCCGPTKEYSSIEAMYFIVI